MLSVKFPNLSTHSCLSLLFDSKFYFDKVIYKNNKFDGVYNRMNMDSVLTDNGKEQQINKILAASYMKILFNFLQIITLISTLNINYNSTFDSFESSQKIVSGAFFKVVSLSCLLQGIFNFTL